MDIPDGDLVRLARDGDPAAFRLLFLSGESTAQRWLHAQNGKQVCCNNRIGYARRLFQTRQNAIGGNEPGQIIENPIPLPVLIIRIGRQILMQTQAPVVQP